MHLESGGESEPVSCEQTKKKKKKKRPKLKRLRDVKIS
jgi:hypothetical protein